MWRVVGCLLLALTAAKVSAFQLEGRLQLPQGPVEIKVQLDHGLQLPQGPVEIKGVVREAGTGQPLAGATVFLEMMPGAPASVVETGPDGSFSLKAESPAGTVKISKRGFRTKSRSNEEEIPALKFREGAQVVDLVRLGAIAGRITDGNGEPLMGIRVEAVYKRIRNGAGRMVMYATANTDDRGQYRLWYLDPGSYWLRALGRQTVMTGYGEFPPPKEGETAYGPSYFPTGATPAEGQAIAVEGGATADANFQLAARPGLRIRGRVLGLAPDEPVTLELSRDGERIAGQVKVNLANGAFEAAGLPPGEYLLLARTRSGDERRGEVIVQLGAADVNGVTVALSSGVSVKGQIHGAGPGRRFGNMGILKPWRGRDGHESYGRPSEGGGIEWDNVIPGRYEFQTNSLNVASILSGNTDVLRDGLLVTQAGCEPLEIRLEPETAQVEFSLEGGKGGRIILLRQFGERVLAASMYVNQMGVPDQVSLAPGEYRVFSERSSDEIEYRDRAVLDTLWNRAAAVTAKAGETVKVTVPVLQGDGTGGIR